MDLEPKQELFVKEYLVDLNATKAAIRAGYSETSASQIGSENLAKPKIQEAIQKAKEARAKRTEITADRVLREIARIAFSDLGQIMDFTGEQVKLRPAKDIASSARRAISSVKVKRHFEGVGEDAREVEVTEFKLWSKEAALEKLCKHLGLAKDRLEITGKDGEAFKVYFGVDVDKV
jgi:phage terminase small subunit